MTEHRGEDERRQQVGEALMDTVAEEGLDRTTLRRVADRAGVSVGLVQRYFASKSDLLTFGIEYVYECTRRRMDEVPVRRPTRAIVEGISAALLPLDPARVRESRVWLAYLQSTMNDAAQQQVRLTAINELLDGFTELLETAKRRGELSSGIDARAEALCLQAFIDGLTVGAVATAAIFEPEVVRSRLRSYVDRLFEVSA